MIARLIYDSLRIRDRATGGLGTLKKACLIFGWKYQNANMSNLSSGTTHLWFASIRARVPSEVQQLVAMHGYQMFVEPSAPHTPRSDLLYLWMVCQKRLAWQCRAVFNSSPALHCSRVTHSIEELWSTKWVTWEWSCKGDSATPKWRMH